jgi:hypothetical protein
VPTKKLGNGDRKVSCPKKISAEAGNFAEKFFYATSPASISCGRECSKGHHCSCFIGRDQRTGDIPACTCEDEYILPAFGTEWLETAQ